MIEDVNRSLEATFFNKVKMHAELDMDRNAILLMILGENISFYKKIIAFFIKRKSKPRWESLHLVPDPLQLFILTEIVLSVVCIFSQR